MIEKIFNDVGFVNRSDGYSIEYRRYHQWQDFDGKLRRIRANVVNRYDPITDTFYKVKKRTKKDNIILKPNVMYRFTSGGYSNMFRYVIIFKEEHIKILQLFLPNDKTEKDILPIVKKLLKSKVDYDSFKNGLDYFLKL